jgi:hypothetical protein
MKYYRQYKLKKELPDYPVGWLFSWCGNRQQYIPHKVDWRTYESKTRFTKDEIESKHDWFEPVGTAKDFYPQFPSQRKLDEFVYLEAETRLVDDVDFCRAFNELQKDNGFVKRRYEFYKTEYEQKFGKN